jgi:hypothetical protein
MHKLESILHNLKDSLSKTEKRECGTAAYAAECITICHHHLQLAKEVVINSGFRYEEQEIRFFREIKPAMLGELNYYIALHQFSATEALLGADTRERHYLGHLEKIEQYTLLNGSFIQYLASGSSHRDKEYFTRYYSDHKLLGEPFAFHIDPAFSTFYDIKAGEYYGHMAFARYLTSGLNSLRKRGHALEEGQAAMEWTGSDVSLVEMAYAFEAEKCINGGQAKIGQIIAGLEFLFNTELKDFSRIFTDIKGRKTSHTLFLDKMRQSLEQKIRLDLQKRRNAR